MKSVKIILLSMITTAMLSGCDHFAFPLHEVEEYRGPKPKKKVVVSVIKSYLRKALKDPTSAQDLVIYDAWYRNWETNGEFSKTPWYVCYTVNAKNSFGGYTGNKVRYVSFNSKNWKYGEGYPLDRCSSVVIYKELGTLKY